MKLSNGLSCGILFFAGLAWLLDFAEANPKPGIDNYSLDKRMLKMGAKLLRKNTNSKMNYVMSPYSIHTALSMVLLGMSREKETSRQLREFLELGFLRVQNDNLDGHLRQMKLYTEHLGIARQDDWALHKQKRCKEDDGDCNLLRNKSSAYEYKLDFMTKLVNSLDGPEYKINPAYQNDLLQHFRTKAETKSRSDWDIVSEVNDWAKRVGFGHGVVRREDFSGHFTLISMIFLRSHWTEPVQKSDHCVFYNYGKDRIAYEGLELENVELNYEEMSTDDLATRKSTYFSPRRGWGQPCPAIGRAKCFKMVMIPMMGEIKYFMIMPSDRSRHALGSLKRELLKPLDDKESLLVRALDRIVGAPEKMRFSTVMFPKFKFETGIDLKDVMMNKFNQTLLFDVTRGEVGKILLDQDGKPENAFINKVKHNAVIDISEKGVKAAGSTVVLGHAITARSPDTLRKLRIDGPFIFLVTKDVVGHHRGRIEYVPLFLGQMVQIDEQTETMDPHPNNDLDPDADPFPFFQPSSGSTSRPRPHHYFTSVSPKHLIRNA